MLRIPARRLVRDSKTNPLVFPSSGRFSSACLFLLFNDIFVQSQVCILFESFNLLFSGLPFIWDIFVQSQVCILFWIFQSSILWSSLHLGPLRTELGLYFIWVFQSSILWSSLHLDASPRPASSCSLTTSSYRVRFVFYLSLSIFYSLVLPSSGTSSNRVRYVFYLSLSIFYSLVLPSSGRFSSACLFLLFNDIFVQSQVCILFESFNLLFSGLTFIWTLLLGLPLPAL